MTKLGYVINPVNEGFTFQVTEQSAEIDAFLSKNVFMSKNTGMKVLASKKPEIKITSGEIFLRGSDMTEDGFVDKTKTGSDHYTKGFVARIDQTLSEFVDHVKGWAKDNYAYRGRAIDAVKEIILA